MDLSGAAAITLAHRANAAQFAPPRATGHRSPHRDDRQRNGVPPTVRRARRAVLALFVVDGAVFGTLAARIPALTERLDLGPGRLGLALTVSGVAALLALPVAGALATRVGTRVLALTSIVAVTGALPVLALVSTVPALVVTLAVLRAANSGLDVAMNAQGSYVERRAGRPVMAGLHAWSSIGALLAAAVATLVIPVAAPLEAHFAGAAVVLACIGLAAVPATLPEPPRLAARPALARPPRAVIALALVAGGAFLVEQVTATFAPVFLRTVTGADATGAAAGFGAFAAAMLVGRLTADRVVRRVGVPRFLRGSGLLLAAGAVTAVGAPTPLIAGVAIGILGLGVAGVAPVVLGAAARTDPRNPGPPIAAVASVGHLGALAGPLAIGGLAELSGLRWAFLLLAAVGAAVAVGAAAPRAPARRGPPPWRP